MSSCCESSDEESQLYYDKKLTTADKKNYQIQLKRLEK